MYPYNLEQNPYPSSPTPTITDAEIIGGKRHKEAKAAVVSCIENLYSKITGTAATDKDFRLVTIIQDVGSGKTHLSLHIRGLKELSSNTIISYTDLSQISPRDLHSLYRAIRAGFTEDYIKEFKKSVVYFLKHKAEHNIKDAKKIFNFGILDSIQGKSLAYKAEEILNGKLILNYSAIHRVLKGEFSSVEIAVIKLILEGKFREDIYNISTLEGIISNITALASLNWKFLRKLTILQIDEFDSNEDSLDFIKAVVNAHLPLTILMLVMTPSSYEEIRKENASVFDRLEKANYKIDLAGSNTLEEVLDILLEYIRQVANKKVFTIDEERDLAAKIKVIYDEFYDFRNIRSMINIMYHAMENAKRRGARTIDEAAIDDTIRSAYPGLRIQGSIMGVTLADFMKIHKSSNDEQRLESDIRDAVINLVNYAHENGSVAKLEEANEKSCGIDLIYDDLTGIKVAVAVIINNDHTKTFDQISDRMKSTISADRFIILTNINAYNTTDKASVVNIDRRKMIDLIYFSSKYKNNEIMLDDSQRALMLAKSIKLC